MRKLIFFCFAIAQLRVKLCDPLWFNILAFTAKGYKGEEELKYKINIL